MIIHGNTKDTLNYEPVWSTLVYGPQGAGKSRFASTFPDPFFIVTERMPRSLDLKKKNIPFAKVDTFADLLEVTSNIATGNLAQSNKTIVLDSLSDITPLVTRHVMAIKNKSQMTLELWGLAVDYLRTYVRQVTSFADTRFVCVTALASLMKDEWTGEILGAPETIGRFAQVVGALFDMCLYAKQDTVYNEQTRQNEPVHKLYTVGLGRFAAKDGIGCLAAEEPNDFNVLLEKYRAKLAS